MTVGTHLQGFERLVQAVDELAANLDEPVVIQYGSSSYIPRHAEGFQWASSQRMEQLTRQARLVIVHAGEGSIIQALRANKPIVVVPRLKVFSEHFNNHQLQIAKAMGSARKAVVVTEPSADALLQAIEQTTGLVGRIDGPAQLITALQEQLARWEQQG